MKYHKIIEHYTGIDNIDFMNGDVQFMKHNGKLSICKWNIPNIKKPTIKELDNYYNNHKEEIETKIKENKKERLIKKEIPIILKRLAIESLYEKGIIDSNGNLIEGA